MGGGGGGGMEVDLTHGAVPAMSRRFQEGPRLRPVLQVAEAPRLVGFSPAAGPERRHYRLLLSDGLHSQRGLLVGSSLNRLARDGALRRGAVVRVLDYFCRTVLNQRYIVVIQLEILQIECTLIGSPKIYEVVAAEPYDMSFSGSLGSDEPCFMSGTQQGANSSSLIRGQAMLNSSDLAVNNLPFSGSYVSMQVQDSVDTKMQQLSLNDNPKNQRFALTATNGSSGPTGDAYGSPMPPTMCTNGRHVGTGDEAPYGITPIAALNPYKGRWTIKARVTAKTDIRHYENARGPAKVFEFDLLDAQGGEIRATCFSLQVDQFYAQIEVDKVYLISRGTVKPANRNFNPLSNDYEIVLDHTTSIEICFDDGSVIPRQQYNPRQIDEIEKNMEGGAMTDQPNAGFTDSQASQSTKTSNNSNGCALNVGGAGYGLSVDQLWREARGCNKMPAPLSGWPECFHCNGGFMDWPSPLAGIRSWDMCYKCKQRGHWAKDCPVRAT
ncbi:hypothetical protein ACP70R_032120 [Stipagrostis hirtigluma subsp. patula]